VIPEGSLVAYVGDGTRREAGLYLEDQGKVVASTPTHSHVAWRTGALQGSVVLVPNCDLVVSRQVTITDDSLDSPLVSLAVLDAYEEGGARKLLSTLARDGHTAGFAAIADEVMSIVSSRIRQDPSFRSVLAQLDDEAGADLVSLASVSLLRDAFRDVA
jgi:hypothetical protein